MTWPDPGSCPQSCRGRVRHKLGLSARNLDFTSRLDIFGAILQKDKQIFSKVSQNQIFPRVVTTLEKAPCAKPLFRLGVLWVSEMGAWLGGFLVLVSAP